MKIFRFDRETGRQIDLYNSSGVILSKMIHQIEEVVIHCAYLEPHGLIGYHHAALPQLFLVMQGDGWVRSESTERKSIQASQAAYWKEGKGMKLERKQA